MDNSVEAALGEHLIGNVGDIAFYQARVCRNCLAVAGCEVIDDGDFVACFQQYRRADGTDVACAASD